MTKKWVKIVEKNGRTFKLIFERDYLDCLWCFGYEIYRPKKHFLDFSYQSQVFCFWTSNEDTIIEQAIEKINNIFTDEETVKRAEKALDKFADYTVS